MNKIVTIFIISIFCIVSYGQGIDSLRLSRDSIPQSSVSSDSLVLKGTALYLVSKDSIQDPVDYGASDRVNFDYAHKVIHLYGNAYIKYQTMEINAAYIKIDMNTSIATAIPQKDSTGRNIGVPHFADRDQKFDAQKLDYNFKSKKGIISEVISKEDDIFIHGKKTKFISKDNPESNGDDIIYSQDAIFTTCDHPHPHFGIHSKKQKVIPNKLVVVGPSSVEVSGIKVPVLPFGFFPISKNRQAGLIFPKNYTYIDGLGFGLEDVGYYWPVNEYMDVKLLSRIFFKGSWGIKANGNYKRRYRYNGNFEADFNKRIESIENVKEKIVTTPIGLIWSHRQDAGAHPYQSFGGNINIRTNGYQRSVNIHSSQVLENTFRSQLTYNRTFPNTPFSLSSSFSHSQNTRTKQVDVTFPSVDIRMRTINPFKFKKNISSEEKWYEKIALNYGSSATNRLRTTDTSLFTVQTLENLEYGVKHSASMDVNFRVLKYFNLTPSVDYREEWFFHRQEKRFDPSLFIDSTEIKVGDSSYFRKDSTYGMVFTDFQKKFGALREFSASTSLNTRIYSTVQLKKGWLRGLRHEMTPNVSLSYAPNYHKNPFQYFKSVDTDTTRDPQKKLEYLIFGKSPFGTSNVGTENFIMNFSLNHRIEIKYKNKSDSLTKKFPIIEGFSMNASYNFFKDSMKLSDLTAGGNNRFFKGLTTINYSFNFSPYARRLVNGKEQLINQYAWKKDKKLAYLTNANFQISTGTNIAQIAQLLNKKKDEKETIEPKDNLPSLFNVYSNFNISHQFGFNIQRLQSGKDTARITVNSLSVNGNIPLTSKWKIIINNIAYDFSAPKGNRIVYPSLGIERDLHCWYMKMDWTPSIGAYSFFIGVKPGSFEFLKIPNSKAFTGAQPF